MSKEAMKLALELLKSAHVSTDLVWKRHDCVQALEESLAKQECVYTNDTLEERVAKTRENVHEPEWYHVIDVHGCNRFYHQTEDCPYKVKTPLYTTPQPKQEQGEPVATPQEIYNKICLGLAEAGCKLSEQQKMALALLVQNTTPQQRKPLTDKQLNIIGSRWHLNLLGTDEKAELFAFARAIEAAHGIKE